MKQKVRKHEDEKIKQIVEDKVQPTHWLKKYGKAFDRVKCSNTGKRGIPVI